SRYYCINSAKYVYRLSDDSPEYSFLEECVFEFNHKAPNVIKESIKDLYPIIHTLAWHRLIKATDYNVHYARRDRVRTILLSFAEE
ncbi:MAG TPA: hypothetical protein PKH37_09790, partial [Alphaproteobacteria bacterium]|nr:hypothetical protein [Alphaproteobacteria bacterium]